MAFLLLFEVLERYARLTLLGWSFLAYTVGLVIYRLYLSPIAKFPGPKFTAITSWCQFYHDVIRGGQFPFVIQRWHEKHGSALSLNMIDQSHLTAHDQGPIIRINPTEIHIADPDFYDIIYSQTRVNKQESFRYRLGIPGSTHFAVEKELHQKRRAALTSYFSRRQVLNFTPYIQKRVDQLCHRLNNEYKGTIKAIKMDDVFAAFAGDNITYYSFARSYDFLNYPDFVTPFATALEKLFDIAQICAHFPWLIPFMESLPKSVSAAIQPSIIPFFDYRSVSINYHVCS